MNPPALHVQPHFLAAPGELFSLLAQTVRWDERMKARRTASFGVAYEYSQMTYEQSLGFHPNNCLLNH